MLRRKVSVSALATQLSEAHIVRENRIKAAHSDFEDTRQCVIEQGAAHAENLRRLEEETRQERQRVEQIVSDARSR